jgi:hypothetical protein
MGTDSTLIWVRHAVRRLARSARLRSACWRGRKFNSPAMTATELGDPDSPDDLDRPDVGALLEAALGLATMPMDASDNGDLVIKSV